MSNHVKILALPIFRRYWLYHAWHDPQAATVARAAKDWRKGVNLEEKMQLLSEKLQLWGWEKLVKQWRSMELAKERTIKSYMYRLAQAVLAREEPEETFLKSVPQHLASLQIIHPSSIPEKEVRRRLRLLTKQRRRKHSIRMISWAATAAPLTLLLLTPIPALPAYYCLYRAFSHRQALAGCRSLTDAFSHNDAQQLQDLRKGLLEMQTLGHKFDPLGWPTKMLQTEPKYLDLLESVSPESAVTAKAQIVYEKKKLEDMVLPKLVASPKLDDIVKPKTRLTSPLEDGDVMKVGSLFAINDLLEHVAKARKRVVGAMFPRHVSK
ncbi:hypothetical protein ABBQ32_010907 [Trebouxia sp. C0010 RCD-2024]